MNVVVDKSVGDSWQEINQRALVKALAMIRARLECWTAQTRRPDGASAAEEEVASIEEAEQQYLVAASAMSPACALESLRQIFNLSTFERDLLLLCAGMELDASIATTCAEAQGDPQRAYPTFGLALAALPQAHWSALAPDAPLRYWRLVEFAQSGGSVSAPLTTRPLRINERALHHLTGLRVMDETLTALVKPPHQNHELAPAHQEIAARIISAWTRNTARAPLPAILLYGVDSESARSIAAHTSASLGLKPHLLHARHLPANPNDLHAFWRLWEREAALSASLLLLDCDDDDSPDAHRDTVIADFADHARGALIVISRERRRIGNRRVIAFEVKHPPVNEQRKVWQAALGETAAKLDGRLTLLTEQFNLDAATIHAAIEEAETGGHSELSLQTLWDACRNQSRSRLDDLAQRIEPSAEWDDLVLPDQQKEILRAVAGHVRQRGKVYETWGFASKGSRGLGISALFAGGSGTGKTMAAEVLARELRLDLYRIDLSSVVSKYIGETEKNLRRVFDAAEGGGAILLFDEADALFGKRSEVKDSHDRYANIEVSYLLQRMESYRGLAILTTNLKSALDTAFLRRIRFIVQFPFPDAAQREEIWKRIFPKDTPVNGIDYQKLAQLNVSGGNIWNIALNAAFMAADADEQVAMSHLLRSARAEYAKLEKLLTDKEVAEWC